MKYDVIGDVHGCYQELVELVKALGYTWNSNGALQHPDERKLVFLGDLTDRGPNSVAVIQLVHRLFQQKAAYYTPGNHCDKLYRYFIGRNVKIANGLETTVAELEALDEKAYQAIRKQFMELVERSPLYLMLEQKKLIIAHAGIKRKWIGKANKKVKTFVLYGDITGEKDENGLPIRRDWAKKEKGDSWIVYGHTPTRVPRIINRTINIDTGCVFGGALTAFRYPELSTASVPSKQPFLPEKFRSFDNETHVLGQPAFKRHRFF